MAISNTLLQRIEWPGKRSMPASTIPSLEESKAVHIEVITEIKYFEKLAKSWSHLLERSNSSNLYLSHDWLYTWWLWFGELSSSSQLSIVCIFKDETLLAIAPFYVEYKPVFSMSIKKTRTLRLLGQRGEGQNIPDSEQLDIIIDSERENHFLVLEVLAQYLKKEGHYTRINFQGITKKSALYQLVSHFPQSQICGLNTITQGVSISLPDSINDLLAQQTFDWKIDYHSNKKKIENMGNIEIRTHSTPGDIHSGLQSLAQIFCTKERKISAGKCSFDGEHYMKFHEDICYLLSIKSRVEIVSLIMDGRLLASVCYFMKKNKTIQVYQMASVKSEGVDFSPMLLLMTHIFEKIIQQGYKHIDFLSSCICSGLAEQCSKNQLINLYTLEWHKNKGHAYFLKSARKLSKALRAG